MIISFWKRRKCWMWILYLLLRSSIKAYIPSKFLNVNNFGIKIFTCQPAQLSFSSKKNFDWLRGGHFHAKIAHVQEHWRYPFGLFLTRMPLRKVDAVDRILPGWTEFARYCGRRSWQGADSARASPCHINGPNSFNPGQIMPVCGILSE